MSSDPETEAVRREIAAERERLREAVRELRARVEQTKRKPLGTSPPMLAGAALLGFVLAGGVHAAIRLAGTRERRRRESREGLTGLFRR